MGRWARRWGVGAGAGVAALVRRLVRRLVRPLLGITDLCLPRECLGCGAPAPRRGRTGLCRACRFALPSPCAQPCRRCGTPLPAGAEPRGRCPSCADRPRHVSEVRAPFAYEGLIRTLIHRFKFGPEPALAVVLGERLTQGLLAEPFTRRPQLVVPVPLHRRRRRARGFNQAALLAKRVASGVAAPLAVHALRRTRHTASQVGRGRSERTRNVRGAFAVRRASRVRGRRVVLVDDVITTGATLAEAARVLRRAGAADVVAAVVARARPGPGSVSARVPGGWG